jgi:hypothetical protein
MDYREDGIIIRHHESHLNTSFYLLVHHPYVTPEAIQSLSLVSPFYISDELLTFRTRILEYYPHPISSDSILQHVIFYYCHVFGF